ncbi:MAG: DUF6184 family natural product biosynthesis lipoprotein [Myxococcaceae bacterium]
MKIRLLWCCTLTALGSACGISRENARDQAATWSCRRAEQCGNIGAGKTYESADSCLVAQKADWESFWPASDCEGKISVANLDTCKKAIEITDCNNGFDVLLTLQKCSKANVCTGGPDANGG